MHVIVIFCLFYLLNIKSLPPIKANEPHPISILKIQNQTQGRRLSPDRWTRKDKSTCHSKHGLVRDGGSV